MVCVSQILLTRHISENVSFNLFFLVSHFNNLGSCCDMVQSDTIGKIELIPFSDFSSNDTNCKDDIQ